MTDAAPEPILTESTLRGADCWFSVDRVPGDDASTRWKRAARYRQAKWREQRGAPIGAQPYDGGTDPTHVGSRLALEYAQASGINFFSTAIRNAVEARLAAPEPHQMINTHRLWADLLSSMPMCFNLFGELFGDEAAIARAVRAWWPDAPKGSARLRFEHSPGRLDPDFLGNRSAFDAAFEIEGDSGCAILGIETKYHEHAEAEETPEKSRLERYTDVTERSGAFVADWKRRLVGTPLQQIWLDHLLVLSMLKHPSKRWTWGRFVLVYPAGNPSFAEAARQYREALVDASTFEARTLEALVDVPDALPERVRAEFRGRYL